MPFIVTTTEGREAYEARRASDPGAYRNQGVSRRAVVTLEEARAAAREASEKVLRRVPQHDFARITESGGSVGPLPDGTVIEVEPATWLELLDPQNPIAFDAHHPERLRPAIIAAYNAKQASHAK